MQPRFVTDDKMAGKFTKRIWQPFPVISLLKGLGRPVTKGGEAPLENFSLSLEKFVGYSLKLLDIVQKNWAPQTNISPLLVSQAGYGPWPGGNATALRRPHLPLSAVTVSLHYLLARYLRSQSQGAKRQYCNLKWTLEDLLPWYCYTLKINSKTIRSQVWQPVPAPGCQVKISIKTQTVLKRGQKKAKPND